jgi:exodeoxyribonuclease VII large subunit
MILEARIKNEKERLRLLSSRRVLTSQRAYVDDKRMELMSLSDSLESSIKRRIDLCKQRVGKNSALLEAVSPLKVISKGYSAVYGEEGKLIKTVSAAQIGERISFRLADGRIGATVTSVLKDKE